MVLGGAKERGQHRGQAVAQERALQARLDQEVAPDDPADHDLVADVLGNRDDRDRNEERQDLPGDRPGRRGQTGKKGDEVRRLEQGRRRDLAEFDEAEDQADDIAGDDAEQDRHDGEEALEHDGEDQNAGQGEEREEEVAQAVAAAGRVGRHADRDAGEAEADHHDHRADHDGRQQAQQPAHAEEVNQDGDDQVDEARAEGAEHGARNARDLGPGDDRRNESERRTEINWNAEPRDRHIKQGAKAAGHQGDRGAEPGQDGHQDGRPEHREEVLQ